MISYLQKEHRCKHQGLCEDLVRPDSWAAVNWKFGTLQQSWRAQAGLKSCPLVPTIPYGSTAPSLPGNVLCFKKRRDKWWHSMFIISNHWYFILIINYVYPLHFIFIVSLIYSFPPYTSQREKTPMGDMLPADRFRCRSQPWWIAVGEGGVAQEWAYCRAT